MCIRNVHSLIRASRFRNLKNVSHYKFSSLISADRILDNSSVHLRLSEKELSKAENVAQDIGININELIVCLMFRNESKIYTDSVLRCKSVNPKVWDFANSGVCSEPLDLYLLSKCRFAVSTFSGPDAARMVFRRPICILF